MRVFLPQFRALRHAEAVLLIHDGQAQIAELDHVLQQRVGTYQHVHGAIAQRFV